MMQQSPQTWHYGLVAKWWSEFNRDGPEIAYYRRSIEGGGEPALDVACGTGRLLLPYLRDGLDVDGCDISPDMISLCRDQAVREGLAPTLFVQAMHELKAPRAYRTIVVCGAFGLGSTREQDVEALSRLYDSLEPGGTLLFDNEAPYASARRWPYWLKEERARLPEPWRPSVREAAADGAEYELRARVVELDSLRQTVSLEMQASMWRDGVLVAEEEHRIDMRLYFRDELLLLLTQAGFRDIDVRGDYTDEPATSDHEMLVFSARKPGG